MTVKPFISGTFDTVAQVSESFVINKSASIPTVSATWCLKFVTSTGSATIILQRYFLGEWHTFSSKDAAGAHSFKTESTWQYRLLCSVISGTNVDYEVYL